MRIGIPLFDEQRRDIAGIIELLDIDDPAASITNENFLGRLSVLQVMMMEYVDREESLMTQLGVPGEVRQRLAADHDELLDLFNDIYLDSMRHSPHTAKEVYLKIRDALEACLLSHGQELHRYAKDAP